ncbi:LOW QUALITY PROTEIN: proteasome maturation protein-like [Panthera tigris]|uniref:LOW QUALITY PROTEIN: proteasome maturation protein-like n=1 Tax=Panthera tigris TaxID=9694 RepID=UPI001C6FA992|nr:LOW QUALITY PROTEIN: proteasome maturation protein-like [Panthera tigris]
MEHEKCLGEFPIEQAQCGSFYKLKSPFHTAAAAGLLAPSSSTHFHRRREGGSSARRKGQEGKNQILQLVNLGLTIHQEKVSSGAGLRGCSQSKLKINARGFGSLLKDSIPVTELSASGPLESHDHLRKGLPCVKSELLPRHPLEIRKRNFQLNQDKMNFSTLRIIQGLFALLELQTEFQAMQQVQRLPFPPSSHLSLDILRGNDETVGFEDILHDPSQGELMGEPHLMVESKLGLL